MIAVLTIPSDPWPVSSDYESFILIESYLDLFCRTRKIFTITIMAPGRKLKINHMFVYSFALFAKTDLFCFLICQLTQ